MKNLLRSSLYLAVFAIAGILFQISCSSDSLSPNAAPVGKIVFTKKGPTALEIWTANYDGTGQTQVPVTLPPNVQFNFWVSQSNAIASDQAHVHLSPDGQTVFFETVTDLSSNKYFSLYSCDLSGNNLTEIIAQAPGEEPMTIGGAY